MKEQLAQMITNAEASFQALKEESTKFIEKDNKSAGTRLRAASMDLIKSMKEIRLKVSEIKNS